MSFGGILGIGEELFAVPLQAIDTANADHATLDVSKQDLKDTKGFNKQHWPLKPNARWANMRTMSGDESQLVGHEEESDQQPIIGIWKASDIVGMNVKNTQGEDLGSIKDLVVDPSRARVTYAILSHGGWAGIGDKLFAIPWQSFHAVRMTTRWCSTSRAIG